ncbi:MAG: hypothetical protein CFK48_00270, partial [Armatimonadetes bacterium CP1_7O]
MITLATAWKTGVTAAAYALAAWVSLQFAYLPDRSSLIWLPAGVALGLTYWWGYRVGLLGTGLGVIGVVYMVWRRWDLALLSAIPVLIQAGTAATLLRSLRVDPRFLHWRDVVWFTGISLVTAIVSPLLNTVLRVEYGITPSQSWALSVLHRWMGDVMGHLVAGGFLLVWWNNWHMRKRDYVALIGLTLLCGVS